MKILLGVPFILQLASCATVSPYSQYNSDESTDSSRGENYSKHHLSFPHPIPIHAAGYGYHHINHAALFGYPQPSFGFHAPAPFFPHPFAGGHYGHGGHGHYGDSNHEHEGYPNIPKQNCTVEEKIQEAEFCVPGLETVCKPVSVDIKIIVDQDLCQDITKTVCTSEIEEVENNICLIVYEPKVVKTTTTTLEVSFGKKCLRQMLTVCQPAKVGYGGHDFSHNFCKEIAQDTCFNYPIVTIKEVDAEVTVPEPVEQCINYPIFLPRIICQEVVTEQCVQLPDLLESSESVQVCDIEVIPNCQTLNISLPHSRCIEIVYGFAHNLNQIHTGKKKGLMESEEDTRESKSIEDAEQFIESTESVLSEELVIAGATIPTTKQPETTIETTTVNIIKETTTVADETTTIDAITTTTIVDNDINMEPRITTVDTQNVSTESAENPPVTTDLPITTQRSRTMAPPTPVLTTSASRSPAPTTGIRIVGVEQEGDDIEAEEGSFTTERSNNIDDGLLELFQETTLPPLAFGARLRRKSFINYG